LLEDEIFDIDADGEIDVEIDFDIGDFSFSDAAPEETRIMRPSMPESATHNFVKFDNALELAMEMDLEPGARTTCIVSGNFILGDLLEALIIHRGIGCTQLYINTLSLSQDNIDSIRTIMDCRPDLEKVNILLSAYFYSHEKHGLVKYMYDTLDIDNRLQVCFVNTHCKVYMFETARGNKYVLHGSANLRSSSNIEQMDMENSAPLYEFYQGMFDRLIERFPTINYAVPKIARGKKSWQVVADAEEDQAKSSQAQQHPGAGQ